MGFIEKRPGERGYRARYRDPLGEQRSKTFVRKADATSVTAFTSPSAGPLGRLVEGEPRLLTRLAGRFTVPVAGPLRPVRTGLVVLVLGRRIPSRSHLSQARSGVRFDVTTTVGVSPAGLRLIGCRRAPCPACRWARRGWRWRRARGRGCRRRQSRRAHRARR